MEEIKKAACFGLGFADIICGEMKSRENQETGYAGSNPRGLKTFSRKGRLKKAFGFAALVA